MGDARAQVEGVRPPATHPGELAFQARETAAAAGRIGPSAHHQLAGGAVARRGEVREVQLVGDDRGAQTGLAPALGAQAQSAGGQGAAHQLGHRPVGGADHAQPHVAEFAAQAQGPANVQAGLDALAETDGHRITAVVEQFHALLLPVHIGRDELLADLAHGLVELGIGGQGAADL